MYIVFVIYIFCIIRFDLQNSNVSDSSLNEYDLDQFADVVSLSIYQISIYNFEKLKNLYVQILVKKVYADKSVRNRRRQWKLKHLDVEDAGSVNSTIERLVILENSFTSIFIVLIFRDYTEFLEDLEEDPDLRQNVNVYRGKIKMKECS